MLLSSTIAPLAVSKSYASVDVEQNTTTMNEDINEIRNDEKPSESNDTQIDLPEKTEIVTEKVPTEAKTEEKQLNQQEETDKQALTEQAEEEKEFEEKISKKIC